MAVPSPVGDVKIVSPINPFVLNTLTLKYKVHKKKCKSAFKVLSVLQGMLVLSLALGEIITGDVEDIPTALPAPLREFLSK